MKGLLRTAATIACSAVLPLSAAFVQDDWHAQATHAPLPVKHYEVAEKDLQRVCGNHGGRYVYGCAIRVPEAAVCIIYTGPQPAAWLMEHERKHCAGWDHGPTHGHGQTVAAASRD